MSRDLTPAPVLGVVMAGGANRRYDGRPKALETVGGVRIADRVIAVLRQATARVVVVANDPETFATLGLEMRPDLQPGMGALGGIHTAVCWAEEARCRAALVVACDMPFVPGALLRRLVDEVGPGEIVAPASASRRGLEPLCAGYAVDCRAAIEAALARGERHVTSFFNDVTVRTLPRDEVARFGDPELIFLNVNTPKDKERAEAIARTAQAST